MTPSANRSIDGDEQFTYQKLPQETATEAVVTAVSSVSGKRPGRAEFDEGPKDTETLPPLYDVIDPDALDSLCQPKWMASRSDVRVHFSYCGCEVEVCASGRINVRTPQVAASGDSS